MALNLYFFTTLNKSDATACVILPSILPFHKMENAIVSKKMVAIIFLSTSSGYQLDKKKSQL